MTARKPHDEPPASAPTTPTVGEPLVDPAEPAEVPTFVRVRDTDTGHEMDVSPALADGDGLRRLNAPKAYPDLYGTAARPRPIKYRTDKAGSSGTTQNEES